MSIPLIHVLKRLLLSSDKQPLAIKSGPFRGLVMDISLMHEGQTYLGLFERETHPWLEALTRGIRVAVDIGVANGEYSVFFLKRTAAEEVYAFEPDDACSASFCRNLELNHISGSGKLKVARKFVGAADEADCITLDSALVNLGGPCFIKLDVDGGEVDVLKGAARINSSENIRWLIETHSADLELVCDQLLRSSGFQTCIIQNAWWRKIIPEQRTIPHNRWLAAWKPEFGAIKTPHHNSQARPTP